MPSALRMKPFRKASSPASRVNAPTMTLPLFAAHVRTHRIRHGKGRNAAVRLENETDSMLFLLDLPDDHASVIALEA